MVRLQLVHGVDEYNQLRKDTSKNLRRDRRACCQLPTKVGDPLPHLGQRRHLGVLLGHVGCQPRSATMHQ